MLDYNYSKLYNLSITGFRFFTVYDPRVRTDMAIYRFTDSIANNRPKLYNGGMMRRDFTFIDDVVNVFTELINRSKADDEPMYNIPNAGDQRAVTMGVFASIIERLNDNNTIRNFSPTELVDVFTAFSYTKRLKSYAGFTPDTELENGLQKTIERYWSRIGPNGNDMFILNVN